MLTRFIAVVATPAGQQVQASGFFKSYEEAEKQVGKELEAAASTGLYRTFALLGSVQKVQLLDVPETTDFLARFEKEEG